jgi:RNA-directed DNA polymerase
MMTQNPNNPWARYADDAVIHCRSKEEAENLLARMKSRFATCKLEIHPDKTRIVYCRSDNNTGRHEHETFDFLGYTFRCRVTKTKAGKFFNAFTPAVSKSAAQSFREKMRECRFWGRMMTPDDLAKLMNPIIRGWANYFTRYCPSEARKKALDYVNNLLVQWLGKGTDG